MEKFKGLEQTFIFQQVNAANGLTTAIGKSLAEGRVLDKKDLEEAFLQINKNFKYPLKYAVLKAFEEKRMILMYAPKGVRIPTYLPFFLTRPHAGGQITAVVNVDIYGKMDEDTGEVTIDAKKLYMMMEGALMAITYYDHHHQLSKRNRVITDGSIMYANMFTRVLNKRYALNIDASKMNKVIYLASKFYLINIIGMKDGDAVMNYAIQNCRNANPYILREIDGALTEDDFANLSTFIQALAKPALGLGMADLHVRGYMEQFIRMYDGSALLALEYFPFFFYTINAALGASFINNHIIFDDIIDKHAAKLYNDLATLAE